ncbi:MAG: Rid family detoxifying hydrolase [Deltaproteobacteria bacterium]
MSEIRKIESAAAPAAIGPYSQAVSAGGLVYCSGQIGLDPATGALVAGGIVAETRQVLANLGEVLRAAGLSFADVVKMTIYLVDMNEFTAMGEVYAAALAQARPARATVAVAALPKGARIEIDATAFTG